MAVEPKMCCKSVSLELFSLVKRFADNKVGEGNIFFWKENPLEHRSFLITKAVQKTASLLFTRVSRTPSKIVGLCSFTLVES